MFSTDLPEVFTFDRHDRYVPGILFAGHDTTAALLGFLTFELSKRPDLQAQIRAEVNDAVGKGEITNLEALEKCKILNACIKET